jgi:UDP-galactopyranose mutase
MSELVVVGGGPTGLGVSYGAGGALILEREMEPGGLCRSMEIDGAVFDYGGHSFHTPHEEISELVEDLAGGVYRQRREARVARRGELLPYPFQQYYSESADRDMVAECRDGLTRTRNPGSAANFEEYLIARFGPGLAAHFMLPYNRKLWGDDLTRIDHGWTSERVASADRGAEKFSNSAGKRRPLQSDTRVGYPADGGFGTIFERLAQRVGGIRYGAQVVEIDAGRRLVRLRDGDEVPYRRLVSTIPLPSLVAAISEASAAVREMAAGLEYLSLRLDMFVTEPLATRVQRVYVADPAVSAHKVAFNHNSSDALRARPRHAVMAETSYLSNGSDPDDAEVRQGLEMLLLQHSLIPERAAILRHESRRMRFAYPVPRHDTGVRVAWLRRWLARFDIYSTGRFGAWRYLNSDGCLHEGLRLGRRLAAEMSAAPSTTAV